MLPSTVRHLELEKPWGDTKQSTYLSFVSKTGGATPLTQIKTLQRGDGHKAPRCQLQESQTVSQTVDTFSPFLFPSQSWGRAGNMQLSRRMLAWQVQDLGSTPRDTNQTDTSKVILPQQYFSPGPGGEPLRFQKRLEDKNLSIIYLVHLVARYCCTLRVTRKPCLFSCKDTQTRLSTL